MIRRHSARALVVAVAVAAAASACTPKATPVDPAHADDATAQALRQAAVETGEALSKLDSALAPTSAMAGTQAAAADGAAAKGPHVPSGGASDPATVAAAAEGRVGKPVAVWFWEEGCKDCDTIGTAWDALSAANADRVVFTRVDVKDAAAADAIKRYRIAKAPAFVVFAADGRPVASAAEWPGAEVFGQYLAQAK